MFFDRHRFLVILLALACLLAAQTVLPVAAFQRDRYRLVLRQAAEGVAPEYVLASALLGGFRGVFMTILWQRAQSMKNDGQYHEMVDIYNIITKLQPGQHNAWAFMAWDLAYNVSVEFDEPPDRVFWVFRGIDLLRKQGIPKCPGVPELAQELAWIYYHKIGQDLDYGHPIYRLVLAQQIMRIFGDPLDSDAQTRYLKEIARLPAEREKLAADPAFATAAAELRQRGFDIFADARRLFARTQRPEEAKDLMERPEILEAVRRAALWKIGNALREQAGMDPAIMCELAERYAPLDWRIPYAHSLYWASRAQTVHLQRNPRKLEVKYARLIYFSLMEMAKRGRLALGEDMYPFYLPEPRFIDAAIAYMDWMFKEFPAQAEALARAQTAESGEEVKASSLWEPTGPRSGYMNFLRDALMDAYFQDRRHDAARYLRKLAEICTENDRPKYQQPLEEYVQSQIKEVLDTPDIETAMRVLAAMLTRGYLALAQGDIDTYRRYDNIATYFYNEYARRRWNPENRPTSKDPDYRYHVPPLRDARRAILMQIFIGMSEMVFTPDMLRALAARLKATDNILWDEVSKALNDIRRRQAEMAEPDAHLMPPAFVK